jgi:DNA-binding response OmpR family regulator
MDKKNILAVDNDPSFLKILSEWFEFQGFDIVTTTESRDVPTLLAQGHFDAVILDVIMGPPNGIELLQEIKKNPATAKLPVFILSQMGEEEHRRRALDFGAEDYLVKSNFRLKDLTEKITAAIGK